MRVQLPPPAHGLVVQWQNARPASGRLRVRFPTGPHGLAGVMA